MTVTYHGSHTDVICCRVMLFSPSTRDSTTTSPGIIWLKIVGFMTSNCICTQPCGLQTSLLCVYMWNTKVPLLVVAGTEKGPPNKYKGKRNPLKLHFYRSSPEFYALDSLCYQKLKDSMLHPPSSPNRFCQHICSDLRLSTSFEKEWHSVLGTDDG